MLAPFCRPALRGKGWVCVFFTAVSITKLFAWGEGDSGGHVLRETTSRGLCGLVCPSRGRRRAAREGACRGGARLEIEPKTPGWLVQIS
jgi:hypothetical protein